MLARRLGFAVAAALAAFACSHDDHPGRALDPTPADAPLVPIPIPTTPGKGPQPNFGETVTADEPPPPISGGTLAVTRDDATAVVADPDRDRVYVVDLAGRNVVTVPLAPHDEPGRVALDDAHHAHVVLRRAGAVATIDLLTGSVVARRAVCAAPRGIAYDAGGARLLVACQGGEVMALGLALDAQASTLTRLSRDLRDVVVTSAGIFVTRFRAAQLLVLHPDGTLASSQQLGIGDPRAGAPVLAWRMIAPPTGGTDPVVVHEGETSRTVAPTPGGYGTADVTTGSACLGGSIVKGAVERTGGIVTALPDQAALPVDVAYDGTTFAVVAAGNGHTPSLPQIFLVDERHLSDLASPSACSAGRVDAKGQITSIAQLRTPRIRTYVAFSREPAELEILPAPTAAQAYGNKPDITPTIIPLASESREDTGHAIFHSNSGLGLACASCHAEGGDDGHVWTFDGFGPRRTPSLRGTVEGTAPYHWGGEEADVSAIVDDVMTGRMDGPALDGRQKDVLARWIFALPPPAVAPPADADAVLRGKALFESDAVGCATCHSGPKLTNNLTYDVGTGGRFQVPSLVGVAARAPLLHDGCAPTLEDRFGKCATAQHGHTSDLSQAQIADLVAYLSTL